jgi:hypothetical protein
MPNYSIVEMAEIVSLTIDKQREYTEQLSERDKYT